MTFLEELAIVLDQETAMSALGSISLGLIVALVTLHLELAKRRRGGS